MYLNQVRMFSVKLSVSQIHTLHESDQRTDKHINVAMFHFSVAIIGFFHHDLLGDMGGHLAFHNSPF